MIVITVDDVLSAAPAPTRSQCELEKRVREFMWNDPDGNRRRPMVDRATLARPHNRGGLNCPFVKDIADSRRVALWMRALYSTEDWACALKKRVMDETGANVTAFIHRDYQTQTMLTKSLVLSNGSDEHIQMMPYPKDSKSMSLFS